VWRTAPTGGNGQADGWAAVVISHALIASHDFTQLRAALVRHLDGDTTAALVLTRIHWRVSALPEGSWWRCNAEQMAAETGLSRDQVNRAIGRLREKKHLETTQECREGPRDRTLSYRIIWDDMSIDAQTAESLSTTVESAPVGSDNAQTALPLDVETAESRHLHTAESRYVPGSLDIEELKTKQDDRPAPNGAAEANGQLALAGAPSPPVPPITAQTIVGEWIDCCAHPPPARVKGQMAREVRLLLEEGINPEAVRRGVAEWMTRDVHPGVLPSIVNNLMNGRPRQRKLGTTDERALAYLEAAERYRREDELAEPRALLPGNGGPE
jgi:hypothetical protein